MARALWSLELLDVEDTTIVDGHPVTVVRGVTIGKSVGAVLIFVLGYLAIATILRRIERRVVARGFDAARARTGKRWLHWLLLVPLLIFALDIARIPLAVFAFLGGALAIGVGFGAQTIIENFIDFGDKALVFALHVWMEIRPGVNAAQILSGVRFIIEESFAEAGDLDGASAARPAIRCGDAAPGRGAAIAGHEPKGLRSTMTCTRFPG